MLMKNSVCHFLRWLLSALAAFLLRVLPYLLRRLSHTALHFSTLLGLVEFLFAIALGIGQCQFYLSSLQVHCLQCCGLFGLLGLMDQLGRIDRSLALRRLPGFPTWLWRVLTFQRGSGTGAGSILAGRGINSEGQQRLAQLCQLLFQLLLLWLCIKSALLYWLLLIKDEDVYRTGDYFACGHLTVIMRNMIKLSTFGRSAIFLCSLLPY